MNHLFFLFIILSGISILVPGTNLVYGQQQNIESGSNYDKEIIETLPNGQQIIKLTSYTYDRILNNDEWVKSIYSNTNEQLIYKSAIIDFNFNKSNCSFNLFDPETKLLEVSNYRNELSIDSEKQIKSCIIESIIQMGNTVNFTTNNGNYKTYYSLNYKTGLEWTYDFSNNQGKQSTFKITETCEDCTPITIDENHFKFGSYIYDTKNETHESFKDIRKINSDYIIEYEKILNDKERSIIDPTFGGTSDTWHRISSPLFTGTDCSTQTSWTKDTNINAPQFNDVGISGRCHYGLSQWDISSITPGSTVTNSQLDYDTGNGDATYNCDIIEFDQDITTASADVIADAIESNNGGSSEIISNHAFCNVANANSIINIDLGSLGDSVIEDDINGDGILSLGYTIVNQLRSSTLFGFMATDNVILTIEYTTAPPPDPVDDLTSPSQTKTSIDLSWTEPNLNGESLIGYQINYTSPHGDPDTIIVNNTGTSTTTYTHTGLTANTEYSHRVTAWTINGNDGGTGNVLDTQTTSFDPPGTPTLGAISISDTTIRFTSIAGLPGDNSTIWYGLRCVLNADSSWDTVVSNASLPVDRRYEYTGLTISDSLTCQWRDGSVDGWSGFSNNATEIPTLSIIQSQREPGSNPLYNVIDWVDSMGGLYFGLSVIPLAVMLIGLLATPKTTHIFTLAMLFVMGILHGSGLYVYPDWYWAMSILLGLVLILGRREK